MVKLLYSKTLWGVRMDPSPSVWESVFQRIREDKYEAVEAIPLTYQSDPILFKSLLEKYSETLLTLHF
jgi:hypothetical protein